MSSVLYVYAVTRDPVSPDAEAVDGSRRFSSAGVESLHAIFTPVSDAEFSQEVIDQRAGDLEWLGAIGYRHQAVMAELMRMTAIVPLRAFTLFSSVEALRTWLYENREPLEKKLTHLAGKQEWTLQLEFEPQKWSASLTSRVASLRELEAEIASVTPGRAFLLRKKLDDSKKKAAHEAEDDLLREVEKAVADRLRCETIPESRRARSGAFPQINVLIDRDHEATLVALRDELNVRYANEGVTLALTGPWPPYSFAGGTR
jgi:hypothetical protein